MLVAAFLVGLPIFFEVGFIILVPLVWNLARETKRSLLFYGLPMAAALTMTHSLVPPHPAPAAATQLLGGDLGSTILYGAAISIPMALAGGMVYGTWIARRIFIPVPEIAKTHGAEAADRIGAARPGGDSAAAASGAADLRRHAWPACSDVPFNRVAVFLGHPFTALTIATLVAIYFFGIRRGLTREKAATMATEVAGADGHAAVHHGRRRRVEADHCRFGRGRLCRQATHDHRDFAAAGGLC